MSSQPTYYFEGDTYFNPQLQLNDSAKKSQVEAFLNELRLTVPQIEQLRGALKEELKYGLQANPPRSSVFPMFNTFATKFPTGREVGDFLALDIGSTNLRVLYLKLRKTKQGKFEKEIDVGFYEVSSDVRKSNSEKFFGFLASSVQDFVMKHNLASEKPIPLGFTFSFPYDQLAIDRGVIVQFAIETNIPDAIGKDPVKLLQASLDALQVQVKVVVIANDVTSTLIYAKYLDQEASVSLIFGSGTNVGYIEDVSKFGRISDPKKTFGEDVTQFVVNTEMALFGGNGEMNSFRSKYEKLVDDNSLFPTEYVYDKLVGGAFMGDHFRYILLDLVQKKFLLNGMKTRQLDTKGSIGAIDISQIEEEFLKTGRADKSVTSLLTRIGYLDYEITPDDCSIITFAAQLVTIRVAFFASVEVSIFVDHLAHLPVVKIGVDGSLYRKHPKMSKLLNLLVNEMCPAAKAELFDAQEGSGIGAAFLAAVVCHKNN